MLVFSAILPHSPLLIENVGKENTKKLEHTINALKKLEENFYASKPETVIILTPHTHVHGNSFMINFAPKFTAKLKDFGDFHTSDIYYGDNGLAHIIKEHLETKLPLQLTTIKNLDYGSIIPLCFLTAHHKEIKIIPISYSNNASFADHFNFGEELAEQINHTNKRVAVIASAELSHKLTKDAPDGYVSGAKKFDQKIIDLLKKKKITEILETETKQVDNVGATEFKSLLILLGILAEHHYTPEFLSYEGPFGAGYLVMNFEM